MVDKPESVFDKLDNQGEKIDDISEKLEGVSVNDLYALAKRTWDYGDYQTAQKYYNHISLLRPLDWEAPLYASLCNFKGYHNMFFWTKVPEQLEPIIVSTIKYINNLDLDKEKKESEMSRCIEIIKDYMEKTNNHYFKYTKDYDDTDANYVFELQEWFVDILDQIKDIELDAIGAFMSFLADSCLYNIKTVQLIASSIDKTKYDYLISIASKDWEIDYELITKKQEELNIQSAKSGSKLTPEEKREIQLKGKMFFEFSDKVIAKRICDRNLLFGILMAVSSASGIICSCFFKPIYTVLFIFSFLSGIFFIMRSFTERERISCSSLLSIKRKRNRLTSNNGVIRENAISFMLIYNIISMAAVATGGITTSITVFIDADSVHLLLKIIYAASVALCSLLHYINLLAFNVTYHNGNYKYLYNGNFYTFE